MSSVADLRLVTFSETPAEEVMQKLRREIERIDKSSDRESAKDHVINAFMTAWHVHEWIWDVIKGKPLLKAAVLSYRGIQDEKIDNQRGFGIALALRFVPLKICRAIATSPRHVDVVLPSENPSQSGPFDALVQNASDVTQDDSLVIDPLVQKTPMVVIMGRPVAATRLLLEIDDYWVTLINDCAIER